MIKTIASTVMTTALLLVSVSCSDSKGDETPSYLTEGKEARPAWTTADNLYSIYEYTMSVQLTLQEVLLPYASEDDLMCAVVDSEIRAVSALQRTGGEVYFPLVIAGNSDSGKVSISYYCSRLKRIFTVANWQAFTPGMEPTQGGMPYVINFIPTEGE